MSSSTLTYKDELITKFISTVINADPELFTIPELHKRIHTLLLIPEASSNLLTGNTSEQGISREIKTHVKELHQLLTKTKNPTERSMKIILKRVLEHEDGETLIEKLLE